MIAKSQAWHILGNQNLAFHIHVLIDWKNVLYIQESWVSVSNHINIISWFNIMYMQVGGWLGQQSTGWQSTTFKKKSWCWVYLHIQDPKHVLQCLVETKNRKLYKKSHWCSKGNITKQSWCIVLSVFIQSTINCNENFVTDDPIYGQVICNSVHKYINFLITRSPVQILAWVMEFSLSHAKNKSITKCKC